MYTTGANSGLFDQKRQNALLSSRTTGASLRRTWITTTKKEIRTDSTILHHVNKTNSKLVTNLRLTSLICNGISTCAPQESDFLIWCCDGRLTHTLGSHISNVEGFNYFPVYFFACLSKESLCLWTMVCSQMNCNGQRDVCALYSAMQSCSFSAWCWCTLNLYQLAQLSVLLLHIFWAVHFQFTVQIVYWPHICRLRLLCCFGCCEHEFHFQVSLPCFVGITLSDIFVASKMSFIVVCPFPVLCAARAIRIFTTKGLTFALEESPAWQ